MILWELKKIFKSKIGLVVLGLFLILLSIMFFQKPMLETENGYRNDEYEWVKDTRAENVISKEKFNEKVKLLKEIADTKEGMPDNNILIKSAKAQLKAIAEYSYKDITFYKVFVHRVDNPAMVFIMILIVVLIFSNVYTEEKMTGVEMFILSSKNKSKALNAKLILMFTLPLIIYWMYVFVISLATFIQYGAPVNGDLGAFRILDMGAFLNKPYSIIEYLMLQIATMSLYFVGIAVVTGLTSLISRNSLTALSLSSVFMGLGKALTVLSFLPKEITAILNYGNQVRFIFDHHSFIGMFCGQIKMAGLAFDVNAMLNIIYILIPLAGATLCRVVFTRVLAN